LRDSEQIQSYKSKVEDAEQTYVANFYKFWIVVTGSLALGLILGITIPYAVNTLTNSLYSRD